MASSNRLTLVATVQRSKPESSCGSDRRAELLDTVFAALPAALLLLDEAGTMLVCNAAAERAFGYIGGEMVGRNVALLLPAEAANGPTQSDRRPRESWHGSAHWTVLGRRKNGSQFPATVAVAEVAAGFDPLFAVLVREVAEESGMRPAQAARHDARLDEFRHILPAIAHELAEPLTAISNYVRASRILHERGSAGEVAAALRKLEVQSARANAIAQRLFDFVRDSEDSRSLQPKP